VRFNTLACFTLVWSLLPSGCAGAGRTAEWPDWADFAGRFVQADGRVIDLTFDQKSTSEGQSYALFFALVGNERDRFDAILKWTSDNLAAGQLGGRLPAWLWGRRDDGRWGVKDETSASDADLWLAYTLLEAARLWKAPAYAETGRRLLALIRQREVVDAGAAGPVLLPGSIGFALDGGRFRVDPSYLPGFMFRYLAAVDSTGPWRQIWAGYLGMTPILFAAGVAPNLFVVDSAGSVMADTEEVPSGSYDAIRVYLWAGMSGASNDPQVALLARYAVLVRSLGMPPEKIDPRTAAVTSSGYSPTGFSGAVLPFLAALGDRPTLEVQHERVQRALQAASRGDASNYYDRALILFGKGWYDGQYRFDEQGRLQPRWMR
jgi:endo-1,4-beta-D-glucanase Y